jgi:hypothetical protein
MLPVPFVASGEMLGRDAPAVPCQPARERTVTRARGQAGTRGHDDD